MHSNKPLHRFTTVHGSTSTPAPSPPGSNCANDNFSRWGAPEFTNFKVTALSENLVNAWTGFYLVIIMANAVISDADQMQQQRKRTCQAQPLQKPA